MWSDDEIDGAFRRLAPPEPAPEPFPLYAWLRLETKLNKDAMEQQFRVRLWKFFAGEMAVLALVALVWSLWPTRQPALVSAAKSAAPTMAMARNSTPAVKAEAAPGTLVPASTNRESAPGAAYKVDVGTASATAVAVKPAAASPKGTGRQPAAAPNTPNLADALAAHNQDGPQVVVEANPGRVRRQVAALANGPDGKMPGELTTDKPAAEKRHLAAAAAAALGVRKRTGTAGAEPEGRGPAATSKATPMTATVTVAPDAATSSPHRSGRRPAFAPAQVSRAATQATGNKQGVKSNSEIEDVAAGKAATDAPAAKITGVDSPEDIAGLAAQSVVLVLPPAATLPASLTALPLATPEPQPKPELARIPRLFIGLVGAPDVSTVRMADFQSPKANLGVVLEYRIFDRLRLSTGLLRGTKVYRAKHEDYDWSYYPTANTYEFEWVDASCTILDLPLNLRYDVLARPRYQVFGSAGLSTLFMQREAYAFDYKYYYRSYRWQQEFVNENQHWLSVFNLSVGYEHRLGQHWSVQAEPYLKLPLGGVGAGKVRLASGGVFFGLKYGL